MKIMTNTQLRTERNKDGSYNIWLSREEYRAIPHAADLFKNEIVIRLMGDCGLRITEVLSVAPSNVSRLDDGRHYELEVTNGKDTTASYDGGKQRET
jgi:integrase